MDEIDEYNALQRFVLNAGPDGWMGYAEELKEAADLLWGHADSGRTVGVRGNDVEGETHRTDKSSVSRTYILLSGLALENILKGLAVSGDPSLINKGELDSRIKTHRLLRLVDLCDGLSLSESETEICRVAQEAIPYWGRYPVPRTFKAIKPEQVADFDYHETFNDLYERLHRATYLAIRDGWDSKVGTTLNSFRSSKYEPDMQAELNRYNKRGNEDA
ncbi:MAG: hypothetical protein GVY12_00360 [Bacteroidetes bacterium]|jgi:hypothetical protein|nr:hypothetical protein [Bacteroidota bacterium]